MTWWRSGGRDSECDAIICDGAVRSGKTLSMSLSFVCWAMMNFDKTQFAFCGKSVRALKRNVVTELLRSLSELGFRCDEKQAQNRIDIRLGKRENIFYLFGGYDEKSSALIQGATFAGVLLDEAALMPRSFVEQACARCSVNGSKLWFNCNPEGPQHWFYREWILRAKERNALYLHFTMDDNPSLSPRIKDAVQKFHIQEHFTGASSLVSGRRHRDSSTIFTTWRNSRKRRRRTALSNGWCRSITVRQIRRRSDCGGKRTGRGTGRMNTIAIRASRGGKNGQRICKRFPEIYR